jgi:hypothetical protein
MGSTPDVIFDIREPRGVKSYERELTGHRRTEGGLRDTLANELIMNAVGTGRTAVSLEADREKG